MVYGGHGVMVYEDHYPANVPGLEISAVSSNKKAYVVGYTLVKKIKERFLWQESQWQKEGLTLKSNLLSD